MNTKVSQYKNFIPASKKSFQYPIWYNITNPSWYIEFKIFGLYENHDIFHTHSEAKKEIKILEKEFSKHKYMCYEEFIPAEITTTRVFIGRVDRSTLLCLTIYKDGSMKEFKDFNMLKETYVLEQIKKDVQLESKIYFTDSQIEEVNKIAES